MLFDASRVPRCVTERAVPMLSVSSSTYLQHHKVVGDTCHQHGFLQRLQLAGRSHPIQGERPIHVSRCVVLHELVQRGGVAAAPSLRQAHHTLLAQTRVKQGAERPLLERFQAPQHRGFQSQQFGGRGHAEGQQQGTTTSADGRNGQYPNMNPV